MSTHEVEKVIGKKIYKGKTYFKLKWSNCREPSWEVEDNCATCQVLIKDYERSRGYNDESEDEWEVEKILNKRTVKKKVQYLVKWRGWPGKPSWENIENCNCINLIAAYENPKLRALWNFDGSNRKLWMSHKDITSYMAKYVKGVKYPITILNFKQDDVLGQQDAPTLREGLNIGPVEYENHWYLVIILLNHITVTRLILVGDSLNILIDTDIVTHPIIRRLKSYYPRHPLKPIRFTQMERSDMCAFYALAAFERATYLFHPKAQFVVDKILYDATRAELIRSETKPETDGQISVSLPLPEARVSNNSSLMCEFCNKFFNTRPLVDDHIFTAHILDRSKSTSKDA